MPTLLGQHLTWNIPKDAGSVSSNGDTDIAWHSMIHFFACLIQGKQTTSTIGWGFGGFPWDKPNSGLLATTWSLVSGAQLLPPVSPDSSTSSSWGQDWIAEWERAAGYWPLPTREWGAFWALGGLDAREMFVFWLLQMGINMVVTVATCCHCV
jgi:hypothetical protein